ncbi:hypothetical protein CEQ90_06800 [Lewinellaceae bacterium SD302]|nr:hypothetical protein CEQ90_06800 [Lewinellaceae bacterium SD302]
MILRIATLLVIVQIIQLSSISAQVQPCPSTECGTFFANIDVSGNLIFCEGETVTLDNTSDAGFEFFIVDWDDGTVDTINDYGNLTHVYDDIFDEPCSSSDQVFEIRFQGLLYCDDGYTCSGPIYPVIIQPPVIAEANVPLQVCVNSNFTIPNQSCNADSYLWTFGDGSTSTDEIPAHVYSNTGNFTVTLEATGSCGTDVFTANVEVVDQPNAVFTASDDDGIACLNEAITFQNQSNSFTNITWSITPGMGDTNVWCFTDTLMTLNSDLIEVVFKQLNTYTITINGSNACGNVSDDIVIEIIEAPEVNLSPPAAACDETTITVADLNYQLDGDATVCWTFTNADISGPICNDNWTATFTENGTVTATANGECGEVLETIDVTVQSSAEPVLTAQAEYCSGDAPDTLTVDQPGGILTGPGVISSNPLIFDPGGADIGNNVLTYTIDNGACSNETSITIVVNESATLTLGAPPVCEDGAPIQLMAAPAGGIWSGDGITDPGGTFDPSQVGGPGVYQPVYTFPDADCEVSRSLSVSVSALPVATVSDTGLVCLVNEDLNLTTSSGFSVDSTGGNIVWTLNGTDLPGETFNPQTDLGGVGEYLASFEYQNGPCTITGDLVISVIENPVLSLSPDDTRCISEGTFQLTANLGDGSWSGPGVDPETGLVDLVAAGGGTFNYTYVFGENTSCEQTGQTQLTIEDPGSQVGAGAQQTICEGTANTLTLTGGTPANGEWTGPGVIDGAAGTVDLTQLDPGMDYEYTYTITGSSSSDCSASANKELRYFASPNTDYTVSGSLCIDESFTLNPVNAAAGTTFCWDFGDGSPIVCDPAPTHVYTSGGNFTISLVATSAEDCDAAADTTVFVTTPPTPDFTLAPSSPNNCAPLTLQIDDLSSGIDYTTQWCIGQDTFNGPPPVDYVLDGFLTDTFINVSLKTTNFCGLRELEDSILVRPYPVVNFGLDTDDGCSPFSPAISNVTRGNPQSWLWDMGNGIIGTDSVAPTVVYTTPDDSVSTYLITLIATNDCGADTLTRVVTVHPPDVTAFISLDTIAGCQPWTFEPESFSTPGANLFWEVFGPDGDLVASGDSVTPSFVLFDAGFHTVILSAARCGADQDTVIVEVLPAPEVSFEQLPQVCVGNIVEFTNTSPTLSGADWDFGDGNTSTDLNPNHVYDSVGVFTVTMTGYSPLNGCPNTTTGVVEITALPEVAFAPQDTADCGPLTVEFLNTTSGTPGLSYSWNFGDGSNNSTEEEPAHAFQETGDYVVTLTATDGLGCVNAATFSSIRVFPDPVANFLVEDDLLCTRYDSLRLTDLSEGATAIFWTVDGVASEVAMPVFAIENPGTATIQLVARNDSLCTDTLLQNYTAIESPAAIIAIEPAEICLGETVDFTSNSTATDALVWELGDQTGSNEAAFVHTYPAADTYTVTLVASAANECPADTATAQVTVNPLPEVAFTTILPDFCGAPAAVGLVNLSNGAVSYEWMVSDGQTFTQFEPVLTIEDPGFYSIDLTAETDFGCRATSSQQITVRGNPVAGFDPPQPLACAPYELNLIADSTQALRYEWYLNGAVLPSTGQRLDTLLTEIRSYDLLLIAIFDEACRDTLDFNELIDLEPRPVADFTYVADDSINVLGDVRFVNQSQFGTDFYWDLGDGTISRLFEPYHEYGINRDIDVLLAVTTNYGGGLVCTDTIVKPIAPEWLTEFFVPTAFSPESNGSEFGQFGAKGVGVAEYTLSVYSPYGQLVYVTGELTEGRPTGRWDGSRPDGELILQGVYTWRAEVTFVDGNYRNMVGTVTVIR